MRKLYLSLSYKVDRISPAIIKVVPYRLRTTFCVHGLEHKNIIEMKQEMGHADLSPIINNYGKPVLKKKKVK